MRDEKETKRYPLIVATDRPLTDADAHDGLRELDLILRELDHIDLSLLSDTNVEKMTITRYNDAAIDFSPLTQVSSLRSVILDYTFIDEEVLSGLAQCESIRELRINTKQEHPLDLRPLNTSKITFLRVMGQRVAHVTLPEIKTVERTAFLVPGASEIDLTPLQNCENLVALNLEFGRPLHDLDLTPLASFDRLNHLAISHSRVPIDLSPLESISGLKELFLNDIELPSIDLTPLGKHSALELLDLANSGLQQIDLSPLSGTSLRELRLEKNDLEELDLEGIPKSIQRLNINDNRLKHINLAPLRGSAIETIELNLNKLEQIDLQPLLSCDNLRKVSLWGNSIRSIVKLIIQIESKRIPDYPFYVEVHGDEEIYPTFYSKVRKSRYY